jgi:two-component system sensor histidine kinase VicK
LFKSIQSRLVFIFVIVAVVLVMPVGLVLNNRVGRIYYREFIESIDYGFENWDVGEGSDVDKLLISMQVFGLDDYKSYTVVSLQDVEDVIWSTDQVDKDGHESQLKSELLASRNFLEAMKGARRARDPGAVAAGGETYYDCAQIVTLAPGDVILYFRYNSRAWSALTADFSNAILVSALLALLVAVVSGYLLARTITDPIKALMTSANSIADGDFDHLADVESDDEIGKLALASNTMAMSLKRYLEEITSEKNKQENILNYARDGIVAYNTRGDVILSNPAARERLGAEAARLPFDEFARLIGMGVGIGQIVASGRIANWEQVAVLGDKSLEINFAVFSDIARRPGGVIAVIHDVTEQRRLESLRREFVANVSHELRTPLTSIISYSETLLDGGIDDPETSGKFLGVIHSEATRLGRLVRELLQLSRFDNAQARWVFALTDVAALARGCVDRMQINARDKQQSLRCYVFGDVPEIWADRDKVEQVLVNVIGNALKYTPERGTISVYVGRMGQEVHVKVSDTGIGIPKQDIPRLFERFFRVDKARSREMGGTGLGLAIAHEIVSGHQGSITVNSELGKGTDVLIRLPVNEGAAIA